MTMQAPPGADRRDAPVVVEQRPSGQDHRYVYEPRSDGNWDRVQYIWLEDGDAWHEAGSVIVESIGFRNLPPEVIENA